MVRLAQDQDHEVLWVNQHGQQKPRQVIGDKVMIRQQPAAPPQIPQILVLSDQMMSSFQHPDKYIKCWAMSGYTFRNYINDIRDQLIELNFQHIVVFIGTMQLGIFDPELVKNDIADLVSAVREFNRLSTVTFVGIVPCPLDHQRSKVWCATFNKLLFSTTDELRRNRGWNCGALDMSDEFMDKGGHIKTPYQYYIDELYLSVAGVQVVRATWLRYFGYFPNKP